MSEPKYNLRTGEWSSTCPCVHAMQVDPECEWHGRPELRRGPACQHCERVIDRDDTGGWIHAATGNVCCAGGEPFNETATP